MTPVTRGRCAALCPRPRPRPHQSRFLQDATKARDKAAELEALLRKAYDELADVGARLNAATDARAALARELDEVRALRQADHDGRTADARRVAELEDQVCHLVSFG